METTKNEKTNESTLSGQETPENSASPVENPDTDSELSSASASNTDPLDVDESEPSSKIPWYKRKKIIYGCVAGACCLALIGGGIAIAANNTPAQSDADKSAKTEQISAKTTQDVKVTLDLPEWSDTSTPALLEINDGVGITYTPITSDKAKDTKLTLEKGTYTLTLVSSINADGSIYIVSDSQTLNVDGTTDTNIQTPFIGTKLPAENVTEEQINAIKDVFNKAKETGKVDQEIVDKVTNNANAGTDARNLKTDEEKQQAQDAAKQETANKQEQAQVSGPETSRPSNGGSSTSTPTHEHSWTPVYITVHQDAVTKEVQEPIYETIETTYCNVKSCNAELTYMTNDEIAAHAKAHALKHEGGGHHSGEPRSVISGYRTIIKTVSDAWDEKVISGYSCSCGATR